MTFTRFVQMNGNWIEAYEDWQGTAAELAATATEVASRLGILERLGVTPSERLVRHYVQLGIVDRPQRAGRKALFGRRQLVQFLAGRCLAEDGWPLELVARYTREVELEKLIDLVPSPAKEGESSHAAFDRALRELPAGGDGQGEPEAWLDIPLLPWAHLRLRMEEARRFEGHHLRALRRALDEQVRPDRVRGMARGEGVLKETRKLALVCDDQGLEPWLAKHLRERGVAVIWTRSTEQALACLEKARVDFVISDLGRVKEGYQERLEGMRLLREIRRRGIEAPFAFYTMNVDHVLREQVVKEGADLITEDPGELSGWLESVGV